MTTLPARLAFSALLSILGLSTVLQAQTAASGDSAPVEVYRLSPGDELAVTVVDEPDLAEVLRIDAQGNINQKFLGLVPVGGRTIIEAETYLANQLIEQKYLRHPVVRLRLVQYSERSIVVFGSVTNPGIVTFPPEISSMDIIDVIAKCGGFSRNAKQASVKVKRRRADGSDDVINVNVRDLTSRAGADRFAVVPGDVITVDRSTF